MTTTHLTPDENEIVAAAVEHATPSPVPGVLLGTSIPHEIEVSAELIETVSRYAAHLRMGAAGLRKPRRLLRTEALLDRLEDIDDKADDEVGSLRAERDELRTSLAFADETNAEQADTIRNLRERLAHVEEDRDATGRVAKGIGRRADELLAERDALADRLSEEVTARTNAETAATFLQEAKTVADRLAATRLTEINRLAKDRDRIGDRLRAKLDEIVKEVENYSPTF